MKKKWRIIVRRLSTRVTIEHKLRSILLSASMVPILCIGLYSAWYSYASVRNEALDYSQQVAGSAADYIEQHFSEYIRRMETFEENERLLNRLAAYQHQDWGDRRETENELRRIMNSLFGSNHEVDTVEYVNPDGVKFYYHLPVTAQQSGLLMQTAAAEGVLWSHGSKESGADEQDYIIISKMLKDNSMLLLSLKKDYVEELCSSYADNNEWLTTILDNDGQAVLQTQRYSETSGQTGFFHSMGNDNLFFTTSPISISGWKVAQGIPYRYLYQGAQVQLLFMLVLLAGLLVVVFGLVRLMMGSILEPLNRLTSAIKSGNMEHSISDQGADEYHEVIIGFNEMNQRINRMITDVLDLELQESRLDRIKKETELSALQKQINPHFLYNTLETIYWNGQYEGAEEISEMVIAVGNYFRNIISKGKEYTTVRLEAESVDNYLYLQNIRFQNSISVVWSLEDNIQEQQILKLVLQPVIEDMINTVLDFRRDKICILVTGYHRFGHIVFSIQLECGGILTDMTQLSQKPGRCNVDERLRLYFGEDSGIVEEQKVLHIFVPVIGEGGREDE